MINILNLTNSGHYSIVIVIVKYLLTIPGNTIRVDELKGRLLLPENRNNDYIDKTIRRWSDLSLFILNQGNLSISEQDIEYLSQHDIRDLIELKLIKADNDLYYALTWLYSQDIFEVQGWKDIQNKIDAYFGQNHDNKPFRRNDPNFAGFISWAFYLKYINVINGKVYLDFSVKLREFIKNDIQENEVESFDFFRRLGERFPFIWSGTLYNRLRSDLLLPEISHPPLNLSISLQILENNKILEFDNMHDNPNKLKLKPSEKTVTNFKISRGIKYVAN